MKPMGLLPVVSAVALGPAFSGRRRGMGTFAGVISAVRISASRGRRLGSGIGPDSDCDADADSLVSYALAPGCAEATAPIALLPSGTAESWSAERLSGVDTVGIAPSLGSGDAFASRIGPDRPAASRDGAPSETVGAEGALMLAVEAS